MVVKQVEVSINVEVESRCSFGADQATSGLVSISEHDVESTPLYGPSLPLVRTIIAENLMPEQSGFEQRHIFNS